jgi:uncharacterized protein (TIGR03437 family)
MFKTLQIVALVALALTLAVWPCAASGPAASAAAGQQGGAKPHIVPFLSQTIAFDKLTTPMYDTLPQVLTATASSGMTVTFAASPSSICYVGPYTPFGSIFATTGLLGVPGTYGTCTVTASQAGGGFYLAAPDVVQKVQIVKPQTIAFNALGASMAVGGFQTLTATASSGLAVSFTASPSSVCTIGSHVDLGLEKKIVLPTVPVVNAVGVGTCTVTATQAGDGVTWGACDSPVSQTVTVTKGGQTIAALPAIMLKVGTTQTISTSATSGLEVSFASKTPAICSVTSPTAVSSGWATTVAGLAVGMCTVDATQPGNANWAAAMTDEQSGPVLQGSQTITFPAPNNTAVGGKASLVATASSGLPVSFYSLTAGTCTVSGSTATMVAIGTCTVEASQTGNTNWAAATPVDRSLTVTGKSQTIAFSALPNQTLGAAPFTIAATATSGLAVTFISLTASICMVNGTTVTLVAVGTCTIQASQPGDGATYAAATPVTQSFNVGSQPSNPAPVIGALVNNYSNLNPAAPNYGIAPGTLLKIWGSNLAAPGSSALPLQNPAGNLPQTLNGSSVSVSIGGVTVAPAFYFAIPSQFAVVLPSSTPVGTGTITVSYGGQTSAPFPITVVANAFGFDNYNGALGVATDNLDGHLITSTASAMPGETIVFWGAGDGANPKNTDVGPPTNWDQVNGITALYIGGVQVPIAYQGRSPYQGVDQIDVTLPSDVPTGCAVSVVAAIGSGSAATVSNLVTIPIAANGGTCADSLAYVSPVTAATLTSQATVAFGVIQVGQTTGPNATGTGTTTTDSADAIFYSFGGGALPGWESGTQPSPGSCVVNQSTTGVLADFAPVGLNAGTVTVQGPVGGVQTLTAVPSEPGAYAAQSLPVGFVPASGGTFTFTATGAANGVGAFKEGLSAPAPLVWTNAASEGTVTRNQGVTVNWTGGGNGFVQIAGGSIAASGTFDATFTCNAAASAGTFTVPPSVLLALPVGTGSLSVANYTLPQNFSVTGLDFAVAIASATTDIAATYN